MFRNARQSVITEEPAAKMLVNFDEWFENWFETHVRMPSILETPPAVPLQTMFLSYRNWLSETKQTDTHDTSRFRKQLNRKSVQKNKAYHVVLEGDAG